MQLLGIHGKKMAGKDTLATIMKEIMGGSVRTIAFGDNMKQICARVSGIPLEWFYDGHLKESVHPQWGKTPRWTMTKMHDVLVAEFGHMIMVNAVDRVWQSPDIQADGLIVTDVRFEWEADWVRRNGGTVVHIIRDATDPLAGSHASERGIAFKAGADYAVFNNGSIEDLKRSAQQFMQWWVGPDPSEMAC